MDSIKNSDEDDLLNSETMTSILVVFSIILIGLIVCNGCSKYSKLYESSHNCLNDDVKNNEYINLNYVKDAKNAKDAKDAKDAKTNKNENLNYDKFVNRDLIQLDHSSEIDPMIMGRLYDRAVDMQDFYADQQRNRQREQTCDDFLTIESPRSYDDGIPKNWAIPSIPIQWYKSHKQDYYGPQGATVYDKGLYNPSVPDHDILLP